MTIRGLRWVLLAVCLVVGAPAQAGLVPQATTAKSPAQAREALELAIAAVSEPREAIVSESADLVFLLLVLWAECGITIDEVRAELTRREGQSGIEGKKARQLT